jgi:hypothetical protein
MNLAIQYFIEIAAIGDPDQGIGTRRVRPGP